jgi:hypothetical protein
MSDKKMPNMPENVAAIAACGFATWASEDIDPTFRERFDARRIPVAGIRNVRVWGLQVHERTQIPDEELWEVNLEAKNGSHYEVDSKKLKAAE